MSRTTSIGALMLIGCLLGLLAGCGGKTAVKVGGAVPEPLTNKLPISAVVVLDKNFNSMITHPTDKISIDLGLAQVEMFHGVFAKLFDRTRFVADREVVGKDELLIVPSVQEVQIATPRDTQLQIYEVWIKYSLEVYDSNEEQLVSWFMPAYGKTPSAFLKSKEEALEQAAQIALRDAGARLILDFKRIPAIHHWLGEDKGEYP